MEPTIATVEDDDSEKVELEESTDSQEPDVDEIEFNEEDFGCDDLSADVEDPERTSTTGETAESAETF